MKRQLWANASILAFCVLVYVVNIWFKKQPYSYDFIFIRNHLNDTLAPIAVLSYIGVLQNVRNFSSISKWYMIFLLCAFSSFVWEFCAVFINPESVSDWYDVLCIFIGGLIYKIYISLFVKGDEKNG